MSTPGRGPGQGNEDGAAMGDTVQSEAQRKLHDLLESMWEQRKGTVVDRLNLLEEAVRNLDKNTTRSSREPGIDAAHKLAGILGTFGLPRGTDLAREIEVAMGTEGPLSEQKIGHLRQVVTELAQLVAQRTLPTSR
jgi:HPt (histidine-containing phosphotransfer) domain-containing protein